MNNHQKVLNIMAVPHSGTTLLKTLLCENENFLNFPEIKHPVLFGYFKQLLDDGYLTKKEICSILDSFLNVINTQKKEVIIQKFPAERFYNYSFLEEIYPTKVNYYVFVKRRIIDFKSVNEASKHNNAEGIKNINFIYEGYKTIYEDFCTIKDKKKIIIHFEDLLKNPSKEISKVLKMMGYDKIVFENGEYSQKVDWEGKHMFIDCKDEDRERVNAGKISTERQEKYKYFSTEFLRQYLSFTNITNFEKRLGTDISSVEKYLSNLV